MKVFFFSLMADCKQRKGAHCHLLNLSVTSQPPSSSTLCFKFVLCNNKNNAFLMVLPYLLPTLRLMELCFSPTFSTLRCPQVNKLQVWWALPVRTAPPFQSHLKTDRKAGILINSLQSDSTAIRQQNYQNLNQHLKASW